MSRNKKSARLNSLKSQAQKISNLNTLDHEKFEKVKSIGNLVGRIDNSIDPKTGTSRLQIIIPNKERPDVYDFSSLLNQPLWAELLTVGFLTWADGKKSNTCRTSYNKLHCGIIKYLATVYPKSKLTFDDLDESFWTSFKKYLDTPKGEKVISHSTRRQRYNFTLVILNLLRGHARDDIRKGVTNVLDWGELNKNLYPGASAKLKPVKTLSTRELLRVSEACLLDVMRIQGRLIEDEAVMEKVLERFNNKREGGAPPNFTAEEFEKDIWLCRVWVEARWPGHIPRLVEIEEENINLFKALTSRKKHKQHGWEDVRKTLVNSFEDLVPFVLLLAMKTAFNSYTILKQKWSNIQETDFGGQEIIRICGKKGRSSSNQTEQHDAEIGVPLGLADVLHTLKRLTSSARNYAPVDLRDKLFIGLLAGKFGGVAEFLHSSEIAGDDRWGRSLLRFSQRYHLTRFNLKQIRPSVGEFVYVSTGGDLMAVKQKLQHKHLKVTRNHYTSDRVRRDGSERIAGVIMLMSRWALTDGAIDPRGRKEFDRNSATPGWLCLDPFESPQPGEKKGRLCAAYGRCPVCPLAGTIINDIYSAACHLAFVDAIYRSAKFHVGGRSWSDRWKPVLQVLQDQVLPEIPENVRKEAERLKLSLRAPT